MHDTIPYKCDIGSLIKHAKRNKYKEVLVPSSSLKWGVMLNVLTQYCNYAIISEEILNAMYNTGNMPSGFTNEKFLISIVFRAISIIVCCL